jgi:hypothetical protein
MKEQVLNAAALIITKPRSRRMHNQAQRHLSAVIQVPWKLQIALEISGSDYLGDLLRGLNPSAGCAISSALQFVRKDDDSVPNNLVSK